MECAARVSRRYFCRLGLAIVLGLLLLCFGMVTAAAESVMLPRALKEIEDEAFLNDASIISVEIPFGAERIGARAFAGCTNLEKITIPKSVSSIGEDVFVSCGNLMIYCVENSFAEEYAIDHGISFRHLPNTVIPDGLEYQVFDTYAVITGYTGAATELVIPDEIQGVSVTEISEKAFYENYNLTQIVLPDTLMSIKEHAFAYSGLESIHLPDSITYLAANSFRGCYRLAKINYPKNWETVGEGNYTPFYGCNSLIEIEIPEGVTNIPDYAFVGCNWLQEVSFPDSLKEIGKYAFQHSSISSIVIPEGVRSISDMAFSFCVSLTDVSLPETLNTLEYGVFYECDGLESIVLPNSITNLDSCIFSYCDNLKKVNYPRNLQSVGSYSPFAWCPKLTEIVIPEGITTLLKEVFEDCNSLVEVTLPSTLKQIPESCFKDGNFSSIVINSQLTEIPYRTFYNCKNLVEVKLPETLLSIGIDAFANCESLGFIDIPDNVTTMCAGAFDHCSSLSEIGYPKNWIETNTYVDSCPSPFTNCPLLSQVSIPEGTVEIPNGAFADCKQLINVSLPRSLRVIGSSSFENTGIQSIILPNSLINIGYSAFKDCMNLKEIYIPNSITKLNGATFSGCRELSKVDLPDTLIEIGDFAFENCVSLKEIHLPDSIINPGSGTFSGCSSLSVANYPRSWDYLTGIGYRWGSPFYGCSLLTQMSIPTGVLAIAARAFDGAKIEKLYIPASVTNIGPYAFDNLPEGFTIYGVSGSYAETYAEENGIAFVPGSISTDDYGDADATFRITVLAPDGTPVDRASLQVYAADNNMLVGSSVTDVNGMCSISGLQKGRVYCFVCHRTPYSYPNIYESTDKQSASVVIRANPMNEAYAVATPVSATLGAVGGSAEFAITASGAWTAVCDAEWLELSIVEGNDSAPLMVSATANAGYLRAAQVLLKTEDVTSAFYVYQAGDLGSRLADPVITSPAENGMILPYDDITIAWDPVEGAVEYAVSLRDLDTQTLMLFHESMKDATSVSFPVGYLNDGRDYRVAVAAIPVGATTKDSVTSWRERTFTVGAQELPTTSELFGYVYELTTPEAVATYVVRTSAFSVNEKEAAVRAAASAEGLEDSPLADVTVTVIDEVESVIVGTTNTNTEGYWRMPELIPGKSYRIEMVKEGFVFRVAYFRYDTVPGENSVVPIYAYNENMDYEGAIGTLLVSYDEKLKMNGSILKHGLFAEYFQYSNNKKFVPAEKRNEGVVDNIDFSWKGDENDEIPGVSYRQLKAYSFEAGGKGTVKKIIDYVPQKFSARFNGYLLVKDPEAVAGMTWYKFRVRGDDGVRLIMRTDDYSMIPGKHESWGKGSNRIATAEPEELLYVNQVLSVTIEYYNHEGWFDQSNLIFEYSKDYGLSDKDSTWYTVPTDWLFCGDRTVEVSDVAGSNYALRLLEANEQIDNYSKTTIQKFVELIADEMVGEKIIDVYSEFNGSGKLTETFVGTIINNINDTIGDEVAKAIYEAIGMGAAGTMTEETLWQQVWVNICDIGGDLVEDWFEPDASQGIDNMNNLVKLTAYLKNLGNQDELLERIWSAVENIPDFNTDNMGQISKDNIFLSLIVGESKEKNIFTDAVYDSIKDANKEIEPILDLCEKGNELLDFVGGLDQSNEARAMLYLMDLESEGTEYTGWVKELLDAAGLLADDDGGNTFWAMFNWNTLKADLRNINSIPNRNITNLLAQIKGVNLTETLYKEVLLMTMDATRSYYTNMFKGLIKN